MDQQQLLSPDQYAQLLTLGSQNQLNANQIQYQSKLADQLRQGNMPQTQMYGRVAVAPSPLAMLGGLARENVAAHKDQQVSQMMQNQAMNSQMQAALMLRALGVGGQQQPQPIQGQGLHLPGQFPQNPALGQSSPMGQYPQLGNQDMPGDQ